MVSQSLIHQPRSFEPDSWYLRAAELLNSLPIPDLTSPTDTEVDSPMSNDGRDRTNAPLSIPSQDIDPNEARLEVVEVNKFLLAKTYFNCREFDRCAAVFMPGTLPKGPLSDLSSSSKGFKNRSTNKAQTSTAEETCMNKGYPGLSQKALFLSLYAKYLSGEKRKDESSEQILGPTDSAAAINRELGGISRILQARFAMHAERGVSSRGWLEYLYGIVLSKEKNDEQAKIWLTKSVTLYPYNWGAWQELCALLASADEVSDWSVEIHRLSNPLSA